MKKRYLLIGLFFLWGVAITGCSGQGKGGSEGGGITPLQMADAIHTVLEADRTVYARLIVHRLQNEEKVIQASEHWKEDKALLLPAQMLRAASEFVREEKSLDAFSFSLQSPWSINKQNLPKTEVEKAGLDFVTKSPGQSFYKEETLGGIRYFTAVYPDVAISEACVKCHNAHKDSLRTDFKTGDVMGGMVVRIKLGS